MRILLSFLGLSFMAAAAACSGGDGDGPAGGGGSGGAGASGGAASTDGGGGAGGDTTTSGDAGGGGGADETGCDTSGAEPILFGANVQPLLQKRCGGPGSCHFHPSPSDGLSLKEGQSHAALVNQQSSAAACDDRTLVVPGNAAQSYLVAKLRETGAPEICGKRMPYDKAKLPEGEIGILVAWICQGAKND